jgi:hypothetical protein
LSSRTLAFVSGVIRRYRKSIGSCWRKLNPGQQALLVLAYLRKGETFAELAAGKAGWAFVVLDGTLIPVDRVAAVLCLTHAQGQGPPRVPVGRSGWLGVTSPVS